MDSAEEGSAFRLQIIERLKKRNLISGQFEGIFASYVELTDYVSRLAQSRRFRSGSVVSEQVDEGRVSELEAELTDLYRKKAQNDQQLIETNNRLACLQNEYESEIALKEKAIEEKEKLKRELEGKMAEIAHLSESNQLLKDEFFALQASYLSLEKKCRDTEEERNVLVERVKSLREEQINFLNEQNEREERERQRSMQSKITEAIQSFPATSDDFRFEIIDAVKGQAAAECVGDLLPTKCNSKFESHEGEVNDVQWFITGQFFATGGSDRKVRLFEMLGGKHEKKATLTGCNGSVMRIDFNLETRQILAAGSDFAVRIWSIDDCRSKHSLTGHGDKVATARFHRGGTRVISGSHDRTIKIWDLSTRKCSRTLFPGSTVLDIVSNDRYNMIISGHFDKKIRMWDLQSEEPVNTISLAGKVTSLSISSDPFYMLCSSRDETLSLIDLRNNQIVHIYSAEQYRSFSDYSRCALSPGMEYCAAGSSDGHIFIWNLRTTKLEKTLFRGGHEHPVTSLSWHPKGHMLLSADRAKTVCLWSS